MADVLHLDHVSVRRGRTDILREVTWEVKDGQRWAVLGPNGAGKTTIVQLAAARLHPSSGTVDVLGERLGHVDVFELRPRIGFSSVALADAVPGAEQVIDVVLTASYGMTGRWREGYDVVDVERARTLLGAFGVEHLWERRFGTLSEGERKRVLIARALMTDPELLVLDEPSAGLDLGGREELVGALGELAADPRSPVLVLVTHHAEEIPPGITHVLLVREGAVQAAGPIAEVLTPEHLEATFGIPLEVTHDAGRWSARAATRPRTGGRRGA